MLHNVRFFKMGYLNKQFACKGTQKIAIMQIFVHFFLKNVNYCRKNTKKKNAGLHSSAFHTKYIKTLRKPFEGVCVTNNLIYTAHRHALAFGNWIAKVDTTPLNREDDQCLRSSHKLKFVGALNYFTVLRLRM